MTAYGDLERFSGRRIVVRHGVFKGVEGAVLGWDRSLGILVQLATEKPSGRMWFSPVSLELVEEER